MLYIIGHTHYQSAVTILDHSLFQSGDEELARIISIANQKGGVGKTTTAVNLSACISMLGKRVLLIDIDPQGNSTSGLGLNKDTVERSTYDVLINETDIKTVVCDTMLENLKLCPSNIQLAGAEIEMVPMISRENKLKIALETCNSDFDFIFIDCPPSLGLLTINSLTASNSVLVPIQCEY